MVNNLVLSLGLKLTSAAGNKLADGSETAGANNLLNSFFQGSMVFFNNVPINSSKYYHHYRSMFHNLVNNTQSQMTTLESEGFIYTTGLYINQKTGGPFQERCSFFRSDASNKKYSGETKFFVGKLYTDVMDLKCGVAPGIEASDLSGNTVN